MWAGAPHTGGGTGKAILMQLAVHTVKEKPKGPTVESLWVDDLTHFSLRPNLIVLSRASRSWRNWACRRSVTCQPREERRYFKWHFVACRSDRNRRSFDQFDMIVPGIQ